MTKESRTRNSKAHLHLESRGCAVHTHRETVDFSRFSSQISLFGVDSSFPSVRELTLFVSLLFFSIFISGNTFKIPPFFCEL